MPEPITIWYIETKDGPKHNHIEHGHSDLPSPKPEYATQAYWLNNLWTRKHAYLLDDGKIAYEIGF